MPHCSCKKLDCLKCKTIKCSKLTADTITTKKLNITDETMISSGWQCNAGIGMPGIYSYFYGFSARILSDTSLINSIYGPYDYSQQFVMGLCSAPALIRQDNQFYFNTLNHLSFSVTNLQPYTVPVEIQILLYMKYATPVDGNIAIIIGTDGTIMDSNYYSNNFPNDKITYKTLEILPAASSLTTSITNIELTQAQKKFILDNLNLYSSDTSADFLFPTDFSTLYTLPPTFHFVAQVTSVLPVSKSISGNPTTLMHGSNTRYKMTFSQIPNY